METGQIYFSTATIYKWYHLLASNDFKEIVIDSLENLSSRKLIDVYSFVIMPSHIHLIWRLNCLNGKETAQGSFFKFTAHSFQKKLRKESNSYLEQFRVNAANKKYEFWQRDPLAILIKSRKMAMKILNYIHFNPLKGIWQLVKDPSEYTYSTASYYELGQTRFSFIKDLRNEF